MALSVGSLFSGIGGIDLGLERAGMVTHWFCEIDPHCRNVLTRHWPGLPIYGDIAAVDWTRVEPVDVLAGGFPCQPISNAGKRLGTNDERWLWPEFARAIRALRPRYVLVENVAALLGRGFGEVISDLAAFGYDVEWDCIPAAAVGAPHLRDRLWTVAYASSDGWARSGASNTQRDDTAAGSERLRPEPARDRAGVVALAHPQGIRRGEGWAESAGEFRRSGPISRSALGYAPGARLPDGFLSPLGGGPQGLPEFQRERSAWWATEPDVGRVAHGVPHRVDRLRALGNAVVPQVVEWIGARIIAFDETRAAFRDSSPSSEKAR